MPLSFDLEKDELTVSAESLEVVNGPQRGCTLRYLWSLLLWLPLSMAPGLQTHRPPVNPVTTQTLPVSPSVLATVVNRGERLELLVLWRGSPGWFTVPSQRRASYSETEGVLSVDLAYGGRDLRLSFDPAGRTATIQDLRVPLQPDANVLLVDDVDGPKGPKLVRALSVPSGGRSADPQLGTLAPIRQTLQGRRRLSAL